MTDPGNCCYHDDKESFNSAFNEIRKLLGIPQHLSKRCAMTVCTCRKNVTHRMSMSRLELDEYQGTGPTDPQLLDKLDSLDNSNDRIGASTKQFISGIVTEKKRKTESAYRILHIIKTALKNDYTLLEEELNYIKSKTDSKQSSSNEPKPVNNTVKIRCVLAKRKRQLEVKVSKTFDIPSGRHIFKYDNQINSLLESIAKQFKPCVIETDKKILSKLPGSCVSSIPVTIWCRKSQHNTVFQELCRNSYTLRGKPIIRRGTYRNYDCDEQSIGRRVAKMLYDQVLNAKETKSDDYSRKILKDNRHSHRVTPQPSAKNAVKCYNCQQPQKTLSVSGTSSCKSGKPWSTECQYHPGFIAHGEWSCCHHDAGKHISIIEQHSVHGCATDTHKWLYQNPSISRSTGGKYLKKKAMKYDNMNQIL